MTPTERKEREEAEWLGWADRVLARPLCEVIEAVDSLRASLCMNTEAERKLAVLRDKVVNAQVSLAFVAHIAPGAKQNPATAKRANLERLTTRVRRA